MFDKKNNKVIIFHNGNITKCPPVINLISCLINNEFQTFVVSGRVNDLPDKLLSSGNFSFSELGDFTTQKSIISKVTKRYHIWRKLREEFKRVVNQGDIIWTTTESSVMYLNKLLEQAGNHHVMQLMELIQYCPISYWVQFIHFPIEKYARNAWKTVVPEINRAYIQKTLWKQERTPYVLPNKPYSLDPGEITPDVQKALEEVINEKRKIILYMGIFGADRDLGSFIKAVDQLGDKYCLMAIGRMSEMAKDKTEEIIKNTRNFKYLGYFTPPQHLHFLKYAHIGLTPYKPSFDIKFASPLNSQYCAPNKIFEYAGYGVPMIGTDVIGLRTPFEKYDIGVCCKDLSPESIVEAIKMIENKYDQMKTNCKEFYCSVDLDRIVNSIIMDE